MTDFTTIPLPNGDFEVSDLFATGGYRATRGTRPVFPTPQEAYEYDYGHDAFAWGQDRPTDAAGAQGWDSAMLRFEKAREDSIYATRFPELGE